MASNDEINAAFDVFNKSVHKVVMLMLPKFVPGFMQDEANRDVQSYINKGGPGYGMLVQGTKDALTAAEQVRAQEASKKGQ
jgi:hypothetical protein